MPYRIETIADRQQFKSEFSSTATGDFASVARPKTKAKAALAVGEFYCPLANTPI